MDDGIMDILMSSVLDVFVLSYVNHTKVTIIMVVSRVSPKSRYSKWHTLSNPTQPSF
jgi:hypothetical protein